MLDIILVAFIVYGAIKLVRDTRGVQLMKGVLLLGVIYVVISALKMQASLYLFDSLFADIIIVLIVLFQPEIRNAIESMGRSSFSNINLFSNKDERERYEQVVRECAIVVSKACGDMAGKKIGALIVFEKTTPLGEVVKTGTTVEAIVTQEIIGNIFFPKSPLLVGAQIKKHGRVHAAGCVLPLTQNNTLTSDLGMRHRAALGMSEQSDAMVVITSEETGVISVAVKGILQRNISEAELREKIIEYLSVGSSVKSIGNGQRIKKFFEGFRKNEEKKD